MTTLYVDTDVSGGTGDGSTLANAYSSAGAAFAAIPGTMDDDYTILCHATSGTADTSTVFTDLVPNGHRLYIEASDDDIAVKTGIDATRYRLAPATGETAITLASEAVTIDGLQIVVTGGGIAIGDNWRVAAGASFTVRNCYLQGPAGDNNERGISVTNANSVVTVQNTIIRGFDTGVWEQNGSVELQQCVIEGSDSIGSYGGTLTNCAVFNSTNDMDGATADHCASDDYATDGGTNAIGPDGGWTNEFEDPTNGDFTLLNTGNLYEGGTTITGGPSTDIDGDSWGATPSIGADEYSAGATQSIVPHIMLAHNQFTGGL